MSIIQRLKLRKQLKKEYKTNWRFEYRKQSPMDTVVIDFLILHIGWLIIYKPILQNGYGVSIPQLQEILQSEVF